MFESDLEENVFRRRLMKEVAPGLPVHLSFYSPSVKVQVMSPAEHMPGANGRYVGNGVTIEFVPEDPAAVERVREFVWHWEAHNEFTAVRKINHLRRGVCPESVEGMLERVRGVDKRAAAKAAEAIDLDELRALLEKGGPQDPGQAAGARREACQGRRRVLRERAAGRLFLHAANRNDRFRGAPVQTELDLGGDLEEQVWEHAARARLLGDPDPLGANEPPGHTTVRNANLLHPLPMTPSLMGRGVYQPEQVELFAETLKRVLVDGERLAGVDALRIQRGKLFHTTKMPGIGFKTRARVLASGLLDDEYGYENLVSIPGVTDAQARTIAEAARAASHAAGNGRAGSHGRRFVSPSLYGFVKEREPVEPEVLATDFLSFPERKRGRPYLCSRRWSRATRASPGTRRASRPWIPPRSRSTKPPTSSSTSRPRGRLRARAAPSRRSGPSSSCAGRWWIASRRW